MMRALFHNGRLLTGFVHGQIHSTAKYSSAEIKNRLSQYPGGSVDLKKDESTGIATITLNQPAKRNALTGTMMIELEHVVSDLEKWGSGRGLILHGADGAFCSGGDLDFVLENFDPAIGGKMCTFMRDVVSRLSSLPLISVAMVEGAAVGGGAELTTSCDFRVMTSNAKIAFVHSRIGVSTGWGAATRLTKIVGPTKALDILLQGHKLTSDVALNIGLVDYILPDDKPPMEATVEWLKERTACPLNVIRAIKSSVLGASTKPETESYKNEQKQFVTTWGGPHHRRGVEGALKGRR